MMGKVWESLGAEIRGPLVSLLIRAIMLGIAVNPATDLLVQRVRRP